MGCVASRTHPFSTHLPSSSCPPRLNLLCCFRRHSSITNRRLVGGGGAFSGALRFGGKGTCASTIFPAVAQLEVDCVVFFLNKFCLPCDCTSSIQYFLPPWHHQQTSSWRWHALLPCTAGAGSRRPPQAFVVVQHPYTVCALFHHCNPLLLFAQGKVLFLVTLPWPRILLWEKINHHLFCDKTSSAHEQDVGVIKDLPVCSSQQPPIQVLQYSRFPCVWPIPQLQFNYGEPEWSLKHVVLMSVLHFTFTIH